MEIFITLLRNKSVLSHACTFTGKGICDVTTPNSNDKRWQRNCCSRVFKLWLQHANEALVKAVEEDLVAIKVAKEFVTTAAKNVEGANKSTREQQKRSSEVSLRKKLLKKCFILSKMNCLIFHGRTLNRFHDLFSFLKYIYLDVSFFPTFELKDEYLFMVEFCTLITNLALFFYYDVILRLHHAIIYVIFRFFFDISLTTNDRNVKLALIAAE